MVSEEQIRQALDSVSVPGFERSLGSLNMVRSVKFSDHSVKLELAGLVMVGLPRQVLGVCPSNNRALNRLQFTRVFTGVRCSLTHK